MIQNINHITLSTSDLERSFKFYREILMFKPLVKWHGGAYFLSGTEENSLWFCLNSDKNCAPPTDYTHYAFTVSIEHFKLLSSNIIQSRARIFKQNNSPGESLYFKDPDGHKLEIHTGSWKTRITEKKKKPGNWKNIEWFI